MAAVDFKEKIKKSKMTLEEGFSTHISSSEELLPKPQQTVIPQNSINTPMVEQPVVQQHTSVNQPLESNRELPMNGVLYRNAPRSTYMKKMTIYVPEDLLKNFDDIYATRMLRGRKTEKSALMCEAIALLYAKEKNDGNI